MNCVLHPLRLKNPLLPRYRHPLHRACRSTAIGPSQDIVLPLYVHATPCPQVNPAQWAHSPHGLNGRSDRTGDPGRAYLRARGGALTCRQLVGYPRQQLLDRLWARAAQIQAPRSAVCPTGHPPYHRVDLCTGEIDFSPPAPAARSPAARCATTSGRAAPTAMVIVELD